MFSRKTFRDITGERRNRYHNGVSCLVLTQTFFLFVIVMIDLMPKPAVYEPKFTSQQSLSAMVALTDELGSGPARQITQREKLVVRNAVLDKLDYIVEDLRASRECVANHSCIVLSDYTDQLSQQYEVLSSVVENINSADTEVALAFYKQYLSH